jgi:NADH-quinone oxidoreductase subunit I
MTEQATDESGGTLARIARAVWSCLASLDAVQIIQGMVTTIKHAPQRPVTIEYPIEYPDVMPELGSRWKGIHYLARYDDGLERCVGCSLCAAACPAHCITVVAAENTEENRVSPGERYAEVYDIDELRCIFCGMCVIACPEDAIRMTRAFELSAYDRESFIYHKEDLLEASPGAEEDPSAWGYS